MNIINVEIYSIVILAVLLMNYTVRFHKKFDTASLLWLVLTVSTMLISISNIALTLFDAYMVRLASMCVYLLSTLVSSLFVYMYVKYVYINPKVDIKKEFLHTLCSILICIIVTIVYVFFSNTGYVIHSFDRVFLSRVLILAIIPNILICVTYIIHTLKNGMHLNYKLIFTLLITVIGLIIDIKSESLAFVSTTFTLTVLIIYINKHEQLLNTDPLTGLSNKRSLEAYLVNLRHNFTIAVYNIDIDKFKLINDKYGHLNGDMVLKAVADLLRKSSRDCDLVIRNGGDEFLIIAEFKKNSDAKKIADRIETNLKSYNENAEIKISLSVGWGLYNSGIENQVNDFSEFLKEIDKDMYKEKEKNHKKKK